MGLLKKIGLTTLLLQTINTAMAYQDQFALSAAVGAGITNISSYVNQNDVWGIGPSFSTQIGYRFTNLELSAFSTINIGILENSKQSTQGSLIEGKMGYRGMAFGPSLRYHTYYSPYNEWQLYLFAAPIFEILNMTPIDDNSRVTGGNYAKGNPIKYEGYGGIIGVGLGKKTTKSTEMLFYQINYKRVAINRLTVMSKGQRKNYIIHKEKLPHHIQERVIIFNIGMVLF